MKILKSLSVMALVVCFSFSFAPTAQADLVTDYMMKQETCFCGIVDHKCREVKNGVCNVSAQTLCEEDCPR